ncbi:hypothetical protein [Cronobacter dublinensis]|uniref:hypothetical protein n=1 Tax=Cronobacter dublinensis TaxID=413497 RepID=UPI0028955CE1|nr:hypothetical protein [Cronobacter dublinensis]MDT3605994.1 hypothetical protein [Cronobacter dublinensis]
MDKSREQFEAWVRIETGMNLYRTKYALTAEEDQQYIDHDINLAWMAWQASRAAVEIELPNGVTTREALDAGYMGDYAAGMDDGIESCANAIRAAGLKVKGE